MELNIHNNLISSFISSYTKIFCHILNISFTNEDIETNIQLLINSFEKLSFEEKNYIILENEIKGLIQNGNIDNKFEPEIFEKDNENNNHINFIQVCSNLRARNYILKECDKIKTRLIAGKIIPSVCTSTASITGFASTQIYTLLHTNNINSLKEISINLAVNMFYISIPKIVKPKTDIHE